MENTLETRKPTRRDYVFFRQRQKNRVFQSVVAYFAKQAEEQGLTKKDLSFLLDRDPAQITRWLKGPGNWELDTISDLLLAMDAEMEFKITPLQNGQANKKDISVVTFMADYSAASGTSSSEIKPFKVNG